MSTPGRNDPCPCGSGKKFKRCCADNPGPVTITDADCDLAMSSLIQFATSARFTDDQALAAELFWGPELDEDGSVDIEDDQSWLFELFLQWYVFDVVTNSGRTVAEIFLAERRAALSPGARLLIEQLIASPLRAVKVATVDSSGLTLVDLLDEENRYLVRDRSAIASLDLDNVLVTRLLWDGDGWRIEGTTSRYDMSEMEPLLDEFESFRTRAREQFPDASTPEARMLLTHIIISFVVGMALADLPQLFDGEPIESTLIEFDVLDHVEVQEALERDPTVEHIPEPGADATVLSYVLVDKDAPPQYRVIADMVLTGTKLVVTTLTSGRARRAQSHIEGLLSDKVRFVRTEKLPDDQPDDEPEEPRQNNV